MTYSQAEDAKSAAQWLLSRPAWWREGIQWAVLDLSRAYQAAYNQALPWAEQVADPFHVVGIANRRLTQTRRRVQEETHGRRGRKQDPLYLIRNLLTRAYEKLDDNGERRLRSLLDSGDPCGEVRQGWHAKETVRQKFTKPPAPKTPTITSACSPRTCNTNSAPGGQPTRQNPPNLAAPDRGLAPRPGHQRIHRSR